MDGRWSRAGRNTGGHEISIQAQPELEVMSGDLFGEYMRSNGERLPRGFAEPQVWL